MTTSEQDKHTFREATAMRMPGAVPGAEITERHVCPACGNPVQLVTMGPLCRVVCMTRGCHSAGPQKLDALAAWAGWNKLIGAVRIADPLDGPRMNGITWICPTDEERAAWSGLWETKCGTDGETAVGRLPDPEIYRPVRAVVSGNSAVLLVSGRPITSFDEAHVPVDVWITKLDEAVEYDEYDPVKLMASGYRWRLVVGCYRPRRGRVTAGASIYVCTHRQPLAAMVAKHILPMYADALSVLRSLVSGETDALYYWS